MFFCVRCCLGVQDNNTLKTLNISYNEIGPEGASALVQALTVFARNVAYLFGFLRFAKHCLYSYKPLGCTLIHTVTLCLFINCARSLPFDPFSLLFYTLCGDFCCSFVVRLPLSFALCPRVA